jgi:hypothetical protein
MNSKKHSRLFGLALLPVLAAGLFLTLQTDLGSLGKDSKENPTFPGAITPGDQDIGSPSIIPSDRDTKNIEYRNIVFSRDNDKASGSAATPGVAMHGRKYSRQPI